MNKSKRIVRLIIELISVIVLVFLDQLTKKWAVATLKNQNPIELIKGVLEFNYLENHGAAFGILQNKQLVFVIAGIIIMVFFLIILYKMPFDKKYVHLNIFLSMIIGGAIGNMIDRIQNNYVIDFIYFKIINFPVFNVADCYVTISTIALAVLILFYYKEEDLVVFGFKKSKQSVETETTNQEE